MNKQFTAEIETEVERTEHPAAPSSDIYIARQPIMDRESATFAYELLFRQENEDAARVNSDNAASSQVLLNTFVDMGVHTVSKYTKVFLNLPRDFILGDLPIPLPAKSLAIEIVGDLEMSAEVQAALRRLGSRGYTLAIDDYRFAEQRSVLLDYVDIVKIDIQGMDREVLTAGVAELSQSGVKLLAKKVETKEEFELCKELGFDYFQGFYFARPKVLSGQSLKPNRLAVLRILAQLQDPDCSVTELERIISNDVGLSFKVLRIINSALYGIPRQVESVKQAIVLLGLKTIRDWMVIITLTDVDDKPHELVLLSLQRAKMMQSAAGDFGLGPDAAFTTGLFSSIDAIMDQSMNRILSELPLNNDVVAALLHRDGELGKLLQTVLHYERGDWEQLDISPQRAQKLGQHYLEAMRWANTLFEELSKQD